MKKNFVRIVAALLVAMLALTLIPMGALASSIGEVVFDKKNPVFNDLFDEDTIWYDHDIVEPGNKLKVDDYETLIGIDGDPYEFKGFASALEPEGKIREWIEDHPHADFDDFMDIVEEYYDEDIHFHKSDIKIPRMPSDPDEMQEWWEKYEIIIAGYVPHSHKLSRWYSDGTTHWKECLICKHYSEFDEDFMYQNWCQDGDEDGICNVCGGTVPYHDVVVIESEGGTITVNKETASHRTKITADVETNEGYTFKKLHFTKVRDDGSKQEITRYQKNGQFWTRMPTYKLEVSAEFVKK